jgi:hypothetical protein
MEALAKAAGATLSELDDDRLETLWSDVKRHEKQTIES